MEDSIIFRDMKDGEEAKVHMLIKKCFDEYIAPDYSDEGVCEFEKYIEPENISRRKKTGHHQLVAVNRGEIIGVIEIRQPNHISLFFVDDKFQGRKIGKRLNEIAIERCLKQSKEVKHITVNSSPYAVAIYNKLGFKTKGNEQLKNGIRFIPMERKL